MPSTARLDSFASPSRSISTKMESLFLDSSPDYGPVKCEVNKMRAIGDMTAPAVPQTSFRERSLQLRRLEDDKNALIDDLIRQLETSQHQLQQLRLDHDRESRYSREGQMRESAMQEELAAMHSVLARNAYITVLIDGDSLSFSKEFWNRGEKGGLDAAAILSTILTNFARENLPSLPAVKIHTKLFLNIRSLTETLMHLKYVDKAETVHAFLRGLTCSDLVFDVIDTSLAKGLTVKKLKESYRHDFVNVHCHQIFLAASAGDDINSLLDEVPDIPLHDRVTLLEANAQQEGDKINHETRSIKMDNLLVKLPTELPAKQTAANKIVAPALARIESNSSSRTMNSGAASATSTPILTWAAMTAQPFVPKPGDDKSGSSTPASKETPPLTKAMPVTSIPRNKHGQRIDHIDDTIPYQELQRIKKMKLCNLFYLQGKNACDGGCNHSHSYPLRTHEKNILKEVARLTPCYYKLDCDDPTCIYGHRCPQSKPGKKDCYYKDDCRFTGWGHGIDDKVVKVQNVK